MSYAKAEIERLQARIQQLGDEGRRALTERDDARSEAVGLQQLLAEADRMVATLEAQRDELADQVEANRARYTDARRERDEARAELAEWRKAASHTADGKGPCYCSDCIEART